MTLGFSVLLRIHLIFLFEPTANEIPCYLVQITQLTLEGIDAYAPDRSCSEKCTKALRPFLGEESLFFGYGRNWIPNPNPSNPYNVLGDLRPVFTVPEAKKAYAERIRKIHEVLDQLKCEEKGGGGRGGLPGSGSSGRGKDLDIGRGETGGSLGADFGKFTKGMNRPSLPPDDGGQEIAAGEKNGRETKKTEKDGKGEAAQPKREPVGLSKSTTDAEWEQQWAPAVAKCKRFYRRVSSKVCSSSPRKTET